MRQQLKELLQLVLVKVLLDDSHVDEVRVVSNLKHFDGEDYVLSLVGEVDGVSVDDCVFSVDGMELDWSFEERLYSGLEVLFDGGVDFGTVVVVVSFVE